jgi:uncharacterized protein (DUF427 family)
MAPPSRTPPGPGQESVWDYPRPPRLERATDRLRVIVAGRLVADTVAGWRVLETSQPPAFYFPAADVDRAVLRPAAGRSVCEWKGLAAYWDVVVGDEVRAAAAWSYPEPTAPFRDIAGHLAFYPQRADVCFVGEEAVAANEGDFYGGWITSRIVGPFKGAAGTLHW